MIVLGIDPGAAGAGYAVWDSDAVQCGGAPIYIGTTCPTAMAVDVIVVESGFIGRMGLKSMWGLGFDAGYRLADALYTLSLAGSFNLESNLYTIRPDGVNGWRAALPPRPDLPAAARFARYDGLPGDVIVARLRLRYSLPDATEHEVEACGIAEAAAAILARPTRLARRALKAVKR